MAKALKSCHESPEQSTLLCLRLARLEELLPFIESVKVNRGTFPELRDPDDAKFITCAATAGVRWLVSGDNDLLSLRHIQSVEIVSVTAILQLLKARP
ncbi:MAG: PIN domain-containing protein [Nitrospira sp.]|nr:PIN domain-containing protein [Nitrospira sp.]